VWKEMERMVDLGLTKSIGVSNCTVLMLIDMLTYAKYPPVTNQVEVHPYFQREDFLKFHKKFNIIVTAYAPLGAKQFSARKEEYNNLDCIAEPLINELAKKYEKTPG
jgi:diketogulonate reductase-like aldo/keto reductase